jgi:hypothetical protein
LAIGFRQSTSGLGGKTTAATSTMGPGLGVIGPAEAPGLASDIGEGPFSPGGVPGMDIELPSPEEPLSDHVGVSSTSQI